VDDVGDWTGMIPEAVLGRLEADRSHPDGGAGRGDPGDALLKLGLGLGLTS